jgi:rhodanese-related sulfurtransferase
MAMGKQRWLAGVAALALGLAALAVAGCGGGESETAPRAGEGSEGAYRTVSPAQLKTMLEAKDFFFVNVHIPADRAIAGTDAFIPFDRVEELIDQFPAAKDAKIVLYCRSGRMSAIAARVLVDRGYTNITELTGGTVAWEAAGYEVRAR